MGQPHLRAFPSTIFKMAALRERVFFRLAAILKIIKEKALGTRLISAVANTRNTVMWSPPVIHIGHPIYKKSVSNLMQIGLNWLAIERLTVLLNVSPQAKNTIFQVGIKLFIMEEWQNSTGCYKTLVRGPVWSRMAPAFLVEVKWETNKLSYRDAVNQWRKSVKDLENWNA